MQSLPLKAEQLDEILTARAGLGESFDFMVRKFIIAGTPVHIYAVNGLCDTEFVMEILAELVSIELPKNERSKLSDILHNRLINQSVETVETVEDVIRQVFAGLIAIKVSGDRHAYVVDVRSYPGRQPEEPDTEKIVRGSRDGFVENIIVNTALTRRRIRDERIRFDMMEVGQRSKADVAVGYIKGLANQDLIDTIKKELDAINVDGLTMTDKSLEEYIVKQGFNPYPLVRFTERADVAATHLLEGHVCIYVDTSPSVMITPTTYFHHVQHAEEFRQSPAVGTFIRWIRLAGIIASIVLLPLWYLMALDPELRPEALGFLGMKDDTNVPLILQLLIADIGIEFLRMAAIHTPTPLATAMGLIAAVLIGQIAIDVGLFVPEVILYVAVAAIGTFATPSYELSVANKIVRVLLLLLVWLFHVDGLVLGLTIYILYLMNVKSFSTPYLWPLVPFRPNAMLRIIMRLPMTSAMLRPMIVKTKDRVRQRPTGE
ncbi:spore germination protein [Jeotgalibacillus proteolyticus]|uniref:Spore germination protein n=1 Tax=Jeotgalibacillus proteolyticus TaxID=2082395 RepID=A0A2S5GE77_9BACL|nr:spore germination protein [Jeotgalibacillus proteolyticus]PPA71306.1 spore germination protein [Jeotgalibacillus proteolyticus]